MPLVKLEFHHTSNHLLKLSTLFCLLSVCFGHFQTWSEQCFNCLYLGLIHYGLVLIIRLDLAKPLLSRQRYKIGYWLEMDSRDNYSNLLHKQDDNIM